MVSDIQVLLNITQIEGAYQADGKGVSNWDVFSHIKGKDLCCIIYVIWHMHDDTDRNLIR